MYIYVYIYIYIYTPQDSRVTAKLNMHQQDVRKQLQGENRCQKRR